MDTHDLELETPETPDVSLLERAVEIAVAAHSGQTQWDGRPYILHPLHVMTLVESDTEKMAAVLHDVVEDSEWTLDDLQSEGFPDEVVLAVGLLSRQPGMSYEQFIEELAHNQLARRVKMADLKHNMDVRRIPQISVKHLTRLEQYRVAYQRLLAEE